MSLGCTIFGFHLDTGIYLRLVWSHHERSFSHGPVHQWLNRSYGAIGPPNERRGCQPNRRRTSCDHFLPIAFGQWYAAIACPQQRFCVRPTCVWISTRDPFAEKFTVIDSVPNTSESTTPKCVDWGSRPEIFPHLHWCASSIGDEMVVDMPTEWTLGWSCFPLLFCTRFITLCWPNSVFNRLHLISIYSDWEQKEISSTNISISAVHFF